MASLSDKFFLTLQGLAKSGRQWNEMVPLHNLADITFADMDITSPLFSDMQWKGSLEPMAGQFVLMGDWQMSVPRRCGRCNVEFAQQVQGKIRVDYTIAEPEGSRPDEEELSADVCDQEILPPPGEVNVLDVLREHFWLSWRPMVVCSEGCKGLCLRCGMDLNDGECDCHGQHNDSPFAALKDFKFNA